jgi:long-chain acyl-CoA synthetase
VDTQDSVRAQRPWIASYDEQVPVSIDYEAFPLYALLDRAAANHPKRTAIVFRNWKIRYEKLLELVEITAANLRQAGVGPGSRISIMLPNLPQSIITYWAALKAGAVVVMTNPLYMEKELVHQLTDADCSHMVTLDLLWPKIADLRERLPVRTYIVSTISDCLAFPLNKLYDFKAKRDGQRPAVPYGPNVLRWKALTKGRERVAGDVADPKNNLALLQYTGGTTGVAKGVMLTHYNMAVNVQQCSNMLHGLQDSPQSFLGLLPYFHVYGLTVCLNWATYLGATMIPFPRYVPRDVLVAIDKLSPTVFPGAPSVYISLMQQKDVTNYRLDSIKYCVSGSAPMPVEQMREFERMTGAEIIEGYGLSEASPVTHINPIKGLHKVGSIGLPFPDTDVRIVDMEVGTVPLPAGKVGEMIIRGPQVMKGYWNRPDDTASTLRNGWLYTGDIAYMDEQGYFYIVDRKKDMIISGGYNVYPREIDEVLYEHPKVKEAVAVGVPHAHRGEIIKAYIVPHEGEEVTRAEIIAHCRQKLANYKVPKQVEFRTELPKTIVGKVLRRALRQEEEDRRHGEGGDPCRAGQEAGVVGADPDNGFAEANGGTFAGADGAGTARGDDSVPVAEPGASPLPGADSEDVYSWEGLDDEPRTEGEPGREPEDRKDADDEGKEPAGR